MHGVARDPIQCCSKRLFNSHFKKITFYEVNCYITLLYLYYINFTCKSYSGKLNREKLLLVATCYYSRNSLYVHSQVYLLLLRALCDKLQVLDSLSSNDSQSSHSTCSSQVCIM